MTEILIEVLAPGLLTTIQDPGRPGVAFYGLPLSGWLDPEAAQLANRLLGNPVDAPILECNLMPPGLRFHGACRIALTGAQMNWRLGDQPATRNVVHSLGPGTTLTGTSGGGGARTYVGIGGDLGCDRVHGSCATDLSSGLGGFEGRRLRKGDALELATSDASPARIEVPEPIDYRRIDSVPLLRGPEWTLLSANGRRALVGTEFAVTSDSNRMAARLSGRLIEGIAARDMPSVPVFPGVMQLPASGRPVVILRDGQTTGGYPRVAMIPEDALGRFCQLPPGQGFRFRLIDP